MIIRSAVLSTEKSGLLWQASLQKLVCVSEDRGAGEVQKSGQACMQQVSCWLTCSSSFGGTRKSGQRCRMWAAYTIVLLLGVIQTGFYCQSNGIFVTKPANIQPENLRDEFSTRSIS